jgi:hypothetical protein
MKKLPIGKQEFKGLIEGDFLYVDKTKYLVSLAESTVPIFLSRPRRFGKSLMVTTFKELFVGNKELFKDTYAYEHWDFEQTNPVIHLDLSQVRANTAEFVSEKLLELVYNAAEDANIDIKQTNHPDIALSRLIRKAGKEIKVAILIDEYDTPILDNLAKKELGEIKEVLRAFYSMIKSNEKFIRFLFITGISKFSHMGVFSTLNHLEDITLHSDYAAVVGYTEAEIRRTFSQEYKAVKKKLAVTEAVFWEKLAYYYNGYSWDGETFVYNPLSILKFFNNNGKFRPYWIETGSPGFIIGYAKDKKFDMTDFEQLEVGDSFLSKQEIEQASPESFLTQAGYLTIKKSKEESYILDFPNQEVRRSFSELILSAQYDVPESDMLQVKPALQAALDAQDTDKIIEQFKIIYSSIPYMYFDSNKNEHFYSALLLMYLQALGLDTIAERVSNKGRLDVSLHNKAHVYIFELKTDSAQKAIDQIITKNYAGAYKNKKVTLVGVQVDFIERNIIKHAVKAL